MQNILIDIAHRGVIPPICVTEYDAMSRFFSITLLDNGAPYTPPTGALYTVRYEVGLNTGWYDTITVPGGTNRGAVSVNGNVFTVEIAEPATHGDGELALMILGDNGYQLTITGIKIASDYVPAESAGETQNYYNAIVAGAQTAAAAAHADADRAQAAADSVPDIYVDATTNSLVITHGGA